MLRQRQAGLKYKNEREVCDILGFWLLEGSSRTEKDLKEVKAAVFWGFVPDIWRIINCECGDS